MMHAMARPEDREELEAGEAPENVASRRVHKRRREIDIPSSTSTTTSSSTSSSTKASGVKISSMKKSKVEKAYEVEAILNVRGEGRNLEFEIK